MTTASRSTGFGWLALALTVLGVLLLFPRLGHSDLWDPWEPKYAQTAREMTERGDWVVPYYRQDPRLVKPPLTYWAIAASHAAFGESEFSSRLPSAVLALVSALALGFGLALRGRRLEGFLAGAALLTAPQWLLLGRSATPDMPLASVGAMLLALAIAFPALEGRQRWVAGVAVAMLLAAAVLIECPQGLLLPAFAVLGWGAVRGGWAGLATMAVVAGAYTAGQHLYVGWLNLVAFGLAGLAAVALLRWVGGVAWKGMVGAAVVVAGIAVPWFVLAYRAAPEVLMSRLFGYKHGINLGETLGAHTGSIGYPLLIVAVGALPWVGAAAVALPGIGRRDGDGVASALGGTLIGVMLFYALAEAKMGHFYGAMQPAVSGLAAIGLGTLAARRDRRIVLAALALYLAGAAVAFDGDLLLEGANVFSDLNGYEPFVVVAGMAVIWVVLITVGWFRGKMGWMLLSIAPAAVLAGHFAMVIVPPLDTLKSQGPMWRRYAERQRPGDTLGTFGWAKASIFYYSRNGVPRLRDRDDLIEFLQGEGRRWIIVPKETFDTMRRIGPPRAPWDRVDERHRYHVLVWTRGLGESHGPTPPP